MADAMPPKPMMPQRGSPVNDNLSSLNPADAQLQFASGQITADMTVRQYLEGKGVDVDGPISQLTQLMQGQRENADPMMKMRKIAADTALQKGGQPPTRPGVKPMVASPGQPSPAGLEGLMSKLGGT